MVAVEGQKKNFHCGPILCRETLAKEGDWGPLSLSSGEAKLLYMFSEVDR